MDSGSGYRNSDPSGLSELAARQHGAVALWQLEALGYTRWAVNRRVRSAQLHPIHRGVYAVGYRRLTIRGHWLAAVLACGPDAVLSHHAAAALWQLRPNPGAKIDVTAPGKRNVVGVRCHVVRALPQPDRTIIDAIPVTTLERTLLDYAEIAGQRQLRAALEAAQRRDLLDVRRLRALLQRSRGRRGTKPLRAALRELHDEAPWTQSELERRFLELVRDAGLPDPQTNVLAAGELVDCVWSDQRLVVELDGYAFHKARRSFEEDRRRDARLQIAGWRVLRLTHQRLRDDAATVMADLRRLLADGWRPPAGPPGL